MPALPPRVTVMVSPTHPPAPPPPPPPSLAAAAEAAEAASHQQPQSPSAATTTTTTTTTTALPRPRAPQDTGFVAIPTTYSAQASPAPGVVAAIVLGSVGGLLLLLALFYSCCGWRPVFMPWRPSSSSSSSATTKARTTIVMEDSDSDRHHHHHRRHHRHRHHHRRRRSHRAKPRHQHVTTEMYEVRAAVQQQQQEPVRVVSTRPPSAVGIPVAAPAGAGAGDGGMPGVRVTQSTASRVVRDEGFSETTGDEIIVIEEHSPPRVKSDSRRSHDSRHSRRYSGRG